MRVFGGSIGVATGFIVLNSLIQQKLTGVLSPQQLDDFYRTPIVITSFNILQQLEVRRTYIQAFTVNMRMCMGISAGCLLASLFTYQRNPPSIKKRLDDLEAVYARSAAISAPVS